MHILLAALVLGCGQALAAHVIQYGNRAGEEADIVSASGLSTAHALLYARITRVNAATYCRAQQDKVTPDCIATNLSFPLKSPATANCRASTFTDLSGNHWRFVGPRTHDADLAKFRLILGATGKEADGSMASGYALAMDIFRALCPKQAPPESAGY